MKRFLIFGFILFLGLVWLADPGFSAPRTESYRSEATAGMFRTEFDRLSDNPAYVGAKLDYKEYENSITKEKTNIFTMADSLNDNGRFIAGGIGDPGLGFLGGIGGLIEIGLQTSPQSLYYDTGIIGNTQVDFNYDYDGKAELNDVYYNDTDGDGEFDEREVLSAEEERYNEDDHLNVKLAAGGAQFGSMTFGVSFERNTDMYGSSSSTGETIRKGGHTYIQENIVDDTLLSKETRSFDQTRTVLPVNYLLTLGAIIPMGGFIETIDAELMINYLQLEIDEDNKDKRVVTDPGIEKVTYTGNSLDWDAVISDNEKRDGLQYGLKVKTREKLFGFDAVTYISWLAGGLTPNKDRKTVYQDYDTGENYDHDYPGNSLEDLRQSEKGTYKYSGDGIAANEIEAGIILRKNITENLLGGIGFAYWFYSSTNEYTRKTVYKQVHVENDGDGVDDGNDYTMETTGSYTDKFTDTEVINAFVVPIGLEYQATPTLCWRIGVVHVTAITNTASKWERGNIRERWEDYDYADVPGNETDSDGPASTTSDDLNIGSFEYNTEERSGKETKVNYSQENSYYFGIGYAVENCVQLDVILTGSSDRFEIDAGDISMSATYVIQ